MRAAAARELEAAQKFRISGKLHRQDLDCDFTSEARIARAIDFAIPPAPIEPTIA